LLNGKGQREVARTFGIGSGTFGTDTFKADHKKVTRHLDEHMGPAYRDALERQHVDSGNALVARMTELDQALDETLRRARQGQPVMDSDGQPVLDPETLEPRRTYQESVILGAVREARRNVELHMRLAGINPEGDQSAVDAALAALGSPEVRRAVADAEALLAEHQRGHGA
jgi:hypothetical protein